MRDDIFKLSPAWDTRGNFPYHFIDNRRGLFEINGFDTTVRLLPSWKKPSLQVYRRGEESEVYLCTAGYFVFGARARSALAGVLEDCAEWLPITVKNLGEFWILHPLQAVRLGDEAKVDRNEVSRNIVDIYHYTFDQTSRRLPSIFFIEQPSDSAAGRKGFVFPRIHLTKEPIRVIERCSIRGIRGEKI